MAKKLTGMTDPRPSYKGRPCLPVQTARISTNGARSEFVGRIDEQVRTRPGDERSTTTSAQ